MGWLLEGFFEELVRGSLDELAGEVMGGDEESLLRDRGRVRWWFGNSRFWGLKGILRVCGCGGGE